jgi:hypothetical protein
MRRIEIVSAFVLLCLSTMAQKVIDTSPNNVVWHFASLPWRCFNLLVDGLENQSLGSLSGWKSRLQIAD